jgi:hypothetical protein
VFLIQGLFLGGETSGDPRNLFLDRALLVQTVGTGYSAFYR